MVQRSYLKSAAAHMKYVQEKKINFLISQGAYKINTSLMYIACIHLAYIGHGYGIIERVCQICITRLC